MHVLVAKLGNIVEGSVLDVNKKHFLKALKQYDEKLYIKWNPKKNKGYGVWEIRREPNKKTLVYQGNFQGSPLYTLEYRENNMVNHVLDVQCLNYEVLNRLREMDAWEVKDYIAKMDYEAARKKDSLDAKIWEERKYLIQQNRKYFRQLQDYVKSGYNPFSFFKGSF